MGRTPCVLVIDDDRLLCELIRTTFDLEGFEVKTASDVIEAERVPVARMLAVRGAGPDHPVALECPETRYLKAVLLQVR